MTCLPNTFNPTNVRGCPHLGVVTEGGTTFSILKITSLLQSCIWTIKNA